MSHIPKLISKTKLMHGFQCEKSLYLELNQKHLIPPVTAELQALFDQGNQVTEMARKRFAGGVLVDFPAYDFIGSLKKTRELLSLQTPIIFEAAFEYKGCYARVDILTYNKLTERWSMLEVKSSTKVKLEHIDDAGLQAWILANSGLPLEKISILHINNECEFPNLENLFTEVDITQELRDRYTTISPRLNKLFKTLREDAIPNVPVGEHCDKPNECQFKEHCWSQLKLPSPNIFDVPGLRDKKWEFFENNKLAVSDLQESDIADLDEKVQKYVHALKSGERFIDREKLKAGLSNWKFPLIFLDFETLNPAIPQYDKVRPFMQVPFQFSVHILKEINSEPEHFEFLHEDLTDPRRALCEKLLEVIPEKGSVVAYYSVFEGSRLQELADYFPQYQNQLLQIIERLVDPLPLLREALYDPQFKDSFSIKSVGPALLDKASSYEGMAVGDGGAAQRAYVRYLSENDVAIKNNLRLNLLQYCKKDTEVLLELVLHLSHDL